MIAHFLRLDRSRRLAAGLALALAGAVLGALLAAGAGTSATAQAPAGKSVSALGIGQVTVKAQDRKSNASIVAAVESSESKAIPQAIDSARERATALAKASGLTLGAVQSVEEQPASPFGFYGPGGPNAYPAPFGKDKYCGDERRPRFVRDSNGRRRVSGTRTVHVCRVPQFVILNLSVTFAAT